MSVQEQITATKGEGIDVLAECHWHMFGMGDIGDKGTALGEHEINGLFRKFAIKFSPDKKEQNME